MQMNANELKLLDGLVDKLKIADGRLRAVILYGSAAAGEYHPEFSDLNVLCVMERLDATTLKSLSPVIAWWRDQKQPPLMLLTVDELRKSADVFAIEFYDMKARHRVLYGDDILSTLEVPMSLHRLQVERELRTNLIKLRTHYLASGGDAKRIARLMADSVSSFVTLFQHALIAMGEQPPAQKREVVRRIASLLKFDAKPFESVLDFREKKVKGQELDADQWFSGYLSIVERVVDEVDRRLA
jgi:predicted nucleotidyltransferase